MNNPFSLKIANHFDFSSQYTHNYVSVGNLTADQANDLANGYAMKFIDNLPRYGGDSTMDLEDIGLSPYIIGIVAFAAGSFAIFGLSLIICPIWCLCRNCMCCLCKKKKPKNKVTKCNIWSKFLFILLCSTVVVVFAALAYDANVDFSGAIITKEGEDASTSLYGVTETMFDDAINTTDTIGNKIMALEDPVIEVIGDVQGLLGSTSIIESGTTDLIILLQDIEDYWYGYKINITFNGTTYEKTCDFCLTIAGTITGVRTEIQSNTNETFATLGNTISSVNDTLVASQGDIIDAIHMGADLLYNTSDMLEDYEYMVMSFKGNVTTYNGYRELAYNILFAFPLLPVVFILLGGVTRFTICFTLSYYLLWITIQMMFFLLGIHLPIALILNDGCKFIDVLEANLSQVMNGSTADIVTACLEDTDVVSVLGLDEQFSFTDQISFPGNELGNITDQFTFGALEQFQSDANATTVDTFMSEGNAALIDINNLIDSCACSSDYFGRYNVSSMIPFNYYPFIPSTSDPNETIVTTLVEKQLLILAENENENLFQSILDNLNANLTSVSVQAGVIEQSTLQVVNEVANASQLATPIFDGIDDVLDAVSCGFIGDAYRDTKTILCESVLGALARICIAMFVIGVIAIPSCCCSFKLVRKFYWYKLQSKGNDNNNNSNMPQRASVILMQPNQQNNQYPAYQQNYQL